MFRIILFLRWCERWRWRWRWRWWLVIILSIDEENESRCHFRFNDLQKSMTRTAEQREITSMSEISELSKSQSRFHKCFDRLVVVILDPTTFKDTDLSCNEAASCQLNNIRKISELKKVNQYFSRIVTEFETLKSRSRSIKFVLRSSMLSFTDLCVHWSVLIHLYDDDTIQVSILYVKFTDWWWYEVFILSTVWSICKVRGSRDPR